LSHKKKKKPPVKDALTTRRLTGLFLKSQSALKRREVGKDSIKRLALTWKKRGKIMTCIGGKVSD